MAGLEKARKTARKGVDETTEQERKTARRIVRDAIRKRSGITSDDLPGDGLLKSAGQSLEARQRKRQSLLDSL